MSFCSRKVLLRSWFQRLLLMCTSPCEAMSKSSSKETFTGGGSATQESSLENGRGALIEGYKQTA